jgi:2-dehydropantoate 2-reductase
MKIMVMGAGGVGGYLGAKLAAAGLDVSFVARGAHLHVLRSEGIKICGRESLHMADVSAASDPRALGIADLIVFTVKLYDTAAAAELIYPVVGPNTAVLTLQNGIDCVPDLMAHFGAGTVLGGAAYFPANLTAPGVITYLGKIESKPHIAFGEPGAGTSQRVGDFLALCREAGISAEASDDTDRMLWEKFLLIAGSSATTALCRSVVGKVRSDPDLRWLLRESIAEAHRVALASGVALSENAVEDVLATLDGNPHDGKSSQLVDLLNGRRLELDGLSGAVIRRGESLGVPTPVHRTVYAALKPFIDGAVPVAA